MTTTVARIQRLVQESRNLNKPIRDCILFLLIGHLITESASILQEISPSIGNKEVYWFLSPAYHNKMEICWYIKYSTQDLFEIITYYCFAKIAALYSTYLFLTVFVFFIYHVVDAILFWWDFKTSHYLYWDLLITAMFYIRGIFKPYKPETIARIKSLF